MMVPVGTTPEEYILDLLGKQNGVVLKSTDVELDYNSTTIGIPNPNSTVTMKVKEGGKFEGAKSVTFNRVHLGNDFFQGINLRIGRDVNKSTVWDYFEPFVQERNLPIQKSDLLLPDTVVDRTGSAFTVQINPLASLVYYGSATIELVKGESLDLADLIMATDVDLFTAPVTTTTDFRFDTHVLAQLLAQLNAANGTNISTAWVDLTVDIPQSSVGDGYNTVARLSARAGNAGNVTGSVDIRYNRVDLAAQFNGIELKTTGNPTNTDRYRRFQGILQANGFPTTNMPTTIVDVSEETAGMNPFTVTMVDSKSWLYTGSLTFSVVDDLAGLWANNYLTELTLDGWEPGAKLSAQLLSYPKVTGETSTARTYCDALISGYATPPLKNIYIDGTALTNRSWLKTYLFPIIKEVIPGGWNYTFTDQLNQNAPMPGPYNLACSTILYCGKTDPLLGHRTDRDYVCAIKLSETGNTHYQGIVYLYWMAKRDLGAATRSVNMSTIGAVQLARTRFAEAETQYPGKVLGYQNGEKINSVAMPAPQPDLYSRLNQQIINLFSAAVSGGSWYTVADATGAGFVRDYNLSWAEVVYYGIPNPSLGHRSDASFLIQVRVHPEYCKNYQGTAEFYWK